MADTLFSHDSVFVIRTDRMSEAREFLAENAIGDLLDDLPSVEQGSIVRYWLPDGEFWWDPAAVECFVGEFCEDGTRVNICESYGDYFIQMKPEMTRIVRREEVYDLIDRIDDIDVELLSPGTLYHAWRRQQVLHAASSAEWSVDDLLAKDEGLAKACVVAGVDFGRRDYETIGRRFLDQRDDAVADDVTWDRVVREYVDGRLAELAPGQAL